MGTVQVGCKEECGRRNAFQDGNFDAGGVRFKVRDRFLTIEIGGTRDALPARQLRSCRVRSRNAIRSKRAPLGLECAKLERDTFQPGILE
jgi:hypothetical protein